MTYFYFISPAIAFGYTWFATVRALEGKPLPTFMGLAACITWLICEVQILHFRGLI